MQHEPLYIRKKYRTHPPFRINRLGHGFLVPCAALCTEISHPPHPAYAASPAAAPRPHVSSSQPLTIVWTPTDFDGTGYGLEGSARNGQRHAHGPARSNPSNPIKPLQTTANPSKQPQTIGNQSKPLQTSPNRCRPLHSITNLVPSRAVQPMVDTARCRGQADLG